MVAAIFQLVVPLCKLNFTSITNAIEERTNELFQVDCLLFLYILGIKRFFLFSRLGTYMEMVLYTKKIFFNIVYRFAFFDIIS